MAEIIGICLAKTQMQVNGERRSVVVLGGGDETGSLKNEEKNVADTRAGELRRHLMKKRQRYQ